MKNSSPLVTVIIPTYNKSIFLDLSLASWCQQEFEDYEIVIVNDGSTDNTLDIINKYSERLPIRTLSIKNSGRAGARNRGLRIAAGSIIAFCDDDRVVHPKFLSAHVNNICSCDSPLVSLGWQYCLLTNIGEGCYFPTEAVAKVLLEMPEHAEAIKSGEAVRLFGASDIENNFSMVENWKLLEPWFEEYLHPAINQFGDDVTECPLVWAFGTTGNMAIEKEVLNMVDPFDEVFSGWGNEDTELHYRLTQKGVRTRVAREAINYHQNHARDMANLKWNWLRTAGVFLNKHPDMKVALYIQAVMWNLPYTEIFQIVRDAEALKGSPLVSAYSRLLLNNARELTTYGDVIESKHGTDPVAVLKQRF